MHVSKLPERSRSAALGLWPSVVMPGGNLLEGTYAPPSAPPARHCITGLASAAICMGDLHFQSPLFVDKPRPGGQSPSPKAAQGVREAKLFLGILPSLLASRKQPERRDGFVKSSSSPRGMSQYFPLRDRAWQRSLA